jgi:hypothetical protein
MATHFLERAACTGTIGFVELSKPRDDLYSSWVSVQPEEYFSWYDEIVTEK